jgi:hypothetical protein
MNEYDFSEIANKQSTKNCLTKLEEGREQKGKKKRGQWVNLSVRTYVRVILKWDTV